jgi:hypothetical protein
MMTPQKNLTTRTLMIRNLTAADYSPDQTRDDHGRFDTSGGASAGAGHAAAQVLGGTHQTNVHETHTTTRSEGSANKAIEAMHAANGHLKAAGFKSKGANSVRGGVTSKFAHPDGRVAKVETKVSGGKTFITVRSGTNIPLGKANFAGRASLNDSASGEYLKGLAGNDEIIGSLSARDKDPKTGFLTAPITIARTGVQVYKARELGLDSHPKLRMPPDKELRLYRPAKEVFAEDSMKAWENCPIIIDHVKGGVNSRNWQQLAVGESRDTKRVTANDTIGGVGIIKAQKGLDAVAAGKRFLSGGYDFDLDLTPGQTPSGEAYDGVQRNIRPNHIALVDNPRGGPACRVHDSTGDKQMKKIIIDGVPVEVADGAESATVEKLLAQRDELKGKQIGTVKVGDASFPADNVVPIQAAFDAVVKERDELRGKVVGDDDVEKRVQLRVKAMDSAKKLVPAIACDGKSVVTIQREAIASVVKANSTAKTTVDAVLGATALDAASEAQVQTAFDVLAATTAAVKTSAYDSTTAFAAAVTTTAQDAKPGTEVIKMPGRDEMLKQQNSLLTKK